VVSFRRSGETKVTAGGETCTVSAGDLLYIPQNVDYTAEYTETETIIIHFVTQHDDGEIKVFSLKNPEKVRRLFDKANALWQEKSTGYYLRTFSLLYEIFGELLKNETDTVLPRNFLNAVAYINENFRDNTLYVEEICSRAQISQSAFRSLFKTHYRITPVDYIIELRLEYARQLIAEGVSVEKAAFESGFNDPKYFARTVKKRLGCTPREFKTYGK
jgi:AraC-like DNA-binding protein